MKKNSKTFKKIAPVALVGLLACGGLGASAWLSTKDIDTQTHSIQAGTFKLAIEGNDVGFESTKAFPITDEVGKALETKAEDGVVLGKLSIKNKGEVSQVVRLFVSTTGFVSEIDENLIHLYVTKAGTQNVVYDGTLAGANGELGFGTPEILAGVANGVEAGVDYDVRMWIDSTATNDNIINGDGSGKQVALHLGVLGIQNDGGITADKNAIDGAEFEVMAGKAAVSRAA